MSPDSGIPAVRFSPTRFSAMAAMLLLCASLAHAGGLGIPTSRAGLGFGNLEDFTGLRFNLQDQNVQRVTGINVTFWMPERWHSSDHDQERGRNQTYQGIGLNLVAASGKRMTGIHLGLLGLAIEEQATGVFAGGLGVGATSITGLAVGGLGVGAVDLRGVFVSGLGIGATDLRGLAASGVVRSRDAQGAVLAVVHHRGDRVQGIASAIYNRADEVQGLMIGVFNRARTLRGVQIGLLNHVDSGPAAARWLPLVNARF